jgi:hypothetical protein
MQDLSMTQEALLASPYLENILKYHVVPGFTLKVRRAATQAYSSLDIKASKEGLPVNRALP